MSSSSIPRRGSGASRTFAGGLTRTQAARLLVLLAAFISFVLSVSLWFLGNEDEGVFVGLWVPSILALGAFLIPRRAS